MMFGEYDHQVDSKFRIRIPSRLKAELGDDYVFMKGAAKCISVYPAHIANEISGQFKNVNIFDAEAQRSLMIFMSSFYTGKEDSQGRVVIEEKLREHAGIVKDVVSVGMVNHIDIYAKEEFERIKNEMPYSEHLKILKDTVK